MFVAEDITNPDYLTELKRKAERGKAAAQLENSDRAKRRQVKMLSKGKPMQEVVNSTIRRSLVPKKIRRASQAVKEILTSRNNE